MTIPRNVKITTVTTQDIGTVVTLYAECFAKDYHRSIGMAPSGLPLSQLIHCFYDIEPCGILIAKINNSPVGFVLVSSNTHRLLKYLLAPKNLLIILRKGLITSTLRRSGQTQKWIFSALFPRCRFLFHSLSRFNCRIISLGVVRQARGRRIHECLIHEACGYLENQGAEVVCCEVEGKARARLIRRLGYRCAFTVPTPSTEYSLYVRELRSEQ